LKSIIHTVRLTLFWSLDLMKKLRQLVFMTLWILSAMPLAAQVGGFTGADDDHDGLPDNFEQAILDKFRPTWKISPTDCDILPAEFLPGVSIPTFKAKNGTIYGQVFIRGSGAQGFFVEAHFYDLWAEDCGYINSHPLDAEHVSVLIRALDSSQPLSEWHATQWYAGAHEDTVCDASQFSPPGLIDAEDKGAALWIARGKHGAFFSQQACSFGGCGFDRCEASPLLINPSPVNIGEPNALLNGAVWALSDRWALAVKMRTDFPTVSTFSSLFYSFSDRGGVAFSTTGSPVSTVLGYARVQSSDRSPAGVSIFSYRPNNVLVTEAAVPNSAPTNSGRFYAEVGGRVRTGLAIANPNSQSVQIAFYFTNSSGQLFGYNEMSIPANGVIGRFLDESPFNSGSFGTGTFTFFSSSPVSAVALRGFTNERNEFMITTLPVSPVAATASQRLVFPQLADGGGWTTQFVLVNTSEEAISGTIAFFGQGVAPGAADPLELTINGQSTSSLTYTIPPRSSWLAVTSGTGAVTRIGSARVTPSASSSAPSGVALFSFRRAGVVVTETGVAATPSGSTFRLFVESAGNFSAGEAGSLQTGIAIANAEENTTTVNLDLTTMSGTNVATSSVVIPGRGQTALFLNQFTGFSVVPSSFQGILRITSNSPGNISVIGLRGRYNERRDFLLATTPAGNESIPFPTGETLFPYLVEGGGYTTQFILSSAGAGSSSGWVRFFTPVGQPLNLTLK
jgi:hypothetical protein